MFIHVDTRPNVSYFRYNRNGSTYSVTSFFTTVKQGSTGETVKLLQQKLKTLGYKGADGKALSTDGSCGKNTVYAIKNFQKANNLTADGIAGPKTWRKL